MSDTEFFERVFSFFESHYPNACAQFQPREKLHRLLFNPEPIDLPSRLIDQAKNSVKAFSEVRGLADRAQSLEAEVPPTPNPGNYSALMSYDFHVDDQGDLRLIEINTNASLSLMTDCLNTVHGLANPFSSNFRYDIVKTFEEEASLAGITHPLSIAIIDEKPENQRLYFEFLLFKELFEKQGHQVLVADSSALEFRAGALWSGETKINLVYNRDTDFYFERHPALREAMIAKACCFSPHPHEYRLLADKERLLELSRPGIIETLAISNAAKLAIEKCLIKTRDFKDFASAEDLWAQRRKLFFKPKRSFGGKAAYRGSSITKTTFAPLFNEAYVAQDFVPAPEYTFPSRPEEPYKFDLRFYVYQDRIQIACARAYRGQMTNTQTPGGGVTAINWI